MDSILTARSPTAKPSFRTRFRPHELSFGLGTALALTPVPANPENVSASQRTRIGQSAGLNYRYHFNGTWSLGAGLGLQRTHQVLRFRSERDTTFFDPLRNRTDAAVGIRTVVQNNYRTTLALPLTLGYHRPVAGGELRLIGGLVYHVGLRESGKGFTPAGDVFEFDTRPDNYVSWRLQAGWNAPLTKRMSLGLEMGLAGAGNDNGLVVLPGVRMIWR